MNPRASVVGSRGQDRYEIPADFDPHRHMEGAWGIVVGEPVTVRLRVDPSVAFWYREPRGCEPSLTIVAEGEDGALDVDLHGHLAADGDIHELLSFLLGWGRGSR